LDETVTIRSQILMYVPCRSSQPKVDLW